MDFNTDNLLNKIIIPPLVAENESYLLKFAETPDEILAAQKLSRGKYSNDLVYLADEDPGLAAGAKVKLYGVSTGPYSILSEEDTVSYPGFDYLFFE